MCVCCISSQIHVEVELPLHAWQARIQRQFQLQLRRRLHSVSVSSAACNVAIEKTRCRADKGEAAAERRPQKKVKLDLYLVDTHGHTGITVAIITAQCGMQNEKRNKVNEVCDKR